jgi:hypothetical protein
MLGESPPVGPPDDDGYPLTLSERGRDRVGRTGADRVGDRESIDDDHHVATLAERGLGVGLVESQDVAVHLGPHEPGRP